MGLRFYTLGKHLHPLLRVDRLDQEDVDVGELQLTHYRLTDNEKMSLEVLDNETKSRAFALVILKMLKSAAGLDESNLRGF